jgi:hypothetical protein
LKFRNEFFILATIKIINTFYIKGEKQIINIVKSIYFLIFYLFSIVVIELYKLRSNEKLQYKASVLLNP